MLTTNLFGSSSKLARCRMSLHFISDLLLGELDRAKWSQPAAAVTPLIGRAATLVSSGPHVKCPIINYESTLMRCFIFRDSYKSLWRETFSFFSFFSFGVYSRLNIHYTLVMTTWQRGYFILFNLPLNSLVISFSYLFFFSTGSNSAEFIKWQQGKKQINENLTVL